MKFKPPTAIIEIAFVNRIEITVRAARCARKIKSEFIVETAAKTSSRIPRSEISQTGRKTAEQFFAETGFRLNLNNRGVATAEFRRKISRNRVKRRDVVRVERACRNRIHAVGGRHAVNDIEQTVVHAANVNQPVILRRRAGNGRHESLQTVAAQSVRRAFDAALRQSAFRSKTENLSDQLRIIGGDFDNRVSVGDAQFDGDFKRNVRAHFG